MTDVPEPVTPLRHAGPTGFSDTAAMDDIQAVLSSHEHSFSEDALAEITEIVERTGRIMVRPRLITATSHGEERGVPSVLVDAEGTYVRIEQDPRTGGVHVCIWTTSEAEDKVLAVHVHGMSVRHSWPGPVTQLPDREARCQARHPADGAGSQS